MAFTHNGAPSSLRSGTGKHIEKIPFPSSLQVLVVSSQVPVGLYPPIYSKKISFPKQCVVPSP
jgi:hypothetical protein